MKVKDKIVIITGAGSGIGAASAKLFAEHGATVVVSDINIENAKKVASEIPDAIAIQTNVAHIEDVAKLIDSTVEKYGRLDIMVNNAGIGPSEMNKTAKHSLSDWDRVIAVNQTGVFYCMKLALVQMSTQGYGNIVNTASLAGLKASGKNIAYAASKFAVVGMTKSAALEYGSKNIRINAVCPGYTKSALLDQLFAGNPDMEPVLRNMVPMKRFGEAKEIAQAIVWLASDDTQFITGQTIVLDGGISL